MYIPGIGDLVTGVILRALINSTYHHRTELRIWYQYFEKIFFTWMACKGENHIIVPCIAIQLATNAVIAKKSSSQNGILIFKRLIK